jgi:hypothetical protein
MGAVSVFARPLVAWSQNFTDSFIGAAYLYCVAPDRPDWSSTGDFVEVDCALLVEVVPGVLRQVPIAPGFISTREPLLIPEALMGASLQLVMSAGFPLALEIWAVSHAIDIDLVQIFEAELRV